MPPGKTILVIDDDPDYRTIVVDFLKQHQWKILEAADGERGLDLARTETPDIVLCDLLMPRRNGLQICRTLRKTEGLKHIPVVISSGRSYDADRQEAFASGADEFLVKPIDPTHLLNVLDRLVERGHHEPVGLESETGNVYLRFWGVRGSVPTPGAGTVKYGGNTSCLELRSGEEVIILDAGTGLRSLGRELVNEAGDAPLNITLLLTHTHWDHIQGLPFFMPLFKPSNRVRILGYEGARLGLETVLSHQMENPFFPIGLREVPANVDIIELRDMQFAIGEISVQACYANHPGICVGYRLQTAQGSIAFFPDNEVSHAHSHPKRPGQLGSSAAPRDRILEFVRQVDVLVMDAQYDSAEYREHVGWGHGCVDDVVKLAAEAGVQHLFLFHHDPDHDDEKVAQMLDHARDLVQQNHWELKVDAAQEGAVYDLAAKSLRL